MKSKVICCSCSHSTRLAMLFSNWIRNTSSFMYVVIFIIFLKREKLRCKGEKPWVPETI